VGAELISKGMVGVSALLDTAGWFNGQVSTPKWAVDLGVSAAGAFGGLPGSVFAGEYYAFDTFYPGGAYGAARDYANFPKDHPEIPGWGLFPP
jgi:hypothetical protein